VDLFKTISETPLPTIFVVAGILFWILAIAGSLAGKITIEPGMRLTAQVAGTVLIALGVTIFLAPSRTDQLATEPTQKPVPPIASLNPAPPTASPAPAAAPAVAVQTPAQPSPPVTEPVVAEKTTELSSPPNGTHTRPSPGVNCSGKGTPDETVICGNAMLIDLDWQLHDLYGAVLKGLDNNKAQQTKLVHDETAWVALRNACKRDADCLVEAYKSRIDQLKSAR
jgi:uncharacterized protein YecT (DUF1311 family)